MITPKAQIVKCGVKNTVERYKTMVNESTIEEQLTEKFGDTVNISVDRRFGNSRKITFWITTE